MRDLIASNCAIAAWSTFLVNRGTFSPSTQPVRKTCAAGVGRRARRSGKRHESVFSSAIIFGVMADTVNIISGVVQRPVHVMFVRRPGGHARQRSHRASCGWRHRATARYDSRRAPHSNGEKRGRAATVAGVRGCLRWIAAAEVRSPTRPARTPWFDDSSWVYGGPFTAFSSGPRPDERPESAPKGPYCADLRMRRIAPLRSLVAISGDRLLCDIRSTTTLDAS
jgi:hypothetical protein